MERLCHRAGISHEIVLEFLLYVLAKRVPVFRCASQGTTIQGITKNTLRTLEIRFPPLEVQDEIVAEIEGYQKVIDGARELIARMEKKIEARLVETWGEEETCE